MKRLAYLDGWRGLAIASVLVGHFVMPRLANPNAFNVGRLGVDLFFALSGLLMARILYEDRVPLAEFYRRRISRIAPAFAFFVLVIFAGCLAIDIPMTLGELASTLTFLRAYIGPPIWSTAVPTQHLWSLNVEEHAYLILSLVTLVPAAFCRRPIILIGLGVLTIAANMAYWLFNPAPNYDLRTECAATTLLFSAGYRAIAPSIRVPGWAALLALAMAVICYFSAVHVAARMFVAPALLAFAVNHIQASSFSRALEWRGIRQLGLWSFSIYLWQQPFYQASGGLIAFACALAAGICSYYVIEQPARRWLNERRWLVPHERFP